MSNPLSMADEDFGKLTEPPVVEALEDKTSTATTTEAGTDTTTTTTEGGEQQQQEEQSQVEQQLEDKKLPKDTSEGVTVPGEEGEQTDANKKPAGEQTPAEQADKSDTGADAGEAGASSGSEAGSSDSPPDFEGFYKQITAPLKANGKTITIKNPEEAIQLMQMGANYTRKMQALAPQRKLVMMLENSGMLDEAQLSFAIDLVKNKNPEAIKKLLKDANIDPLGIDTSTEPTYREGNHRVSDEEAGFATALEDLRSNPGGSETLQHINTVWDQASKDVLWKDPSILEVVRQQRVSGVYDRVAAEVERLKTLGQIPANVSFLQAYHKVGNDMASAGGLADLVETQQTKIQDKTPVTTRVVVKKPVVQNSDKASAASASRSTTKTAEVKVNPLGMSDEDFMKQPAPRP